MVSLFISHNIEMECVNNIADSCDKYTIIDYNPVFLKQRYILIILKYIFNCTSTI